MITGMNAAASTLACPSASEQNDVPHAAEHPLACQCLELHAVDLLSAAGAVTLKRTETRIVTGVVVLRARIAQSDHDPLDRLGCLCGFFFIQLLKNIEY